MTPSQASELLSIAAAFDNRLPNERAARVWAVALDKFDPMMCGDAIIAHYQSSSDFVMPSHIIDICRPRIRAAKEAAAQEAERAELSERPVRKAIEKLADGWDIDR